MGREALPEGQDGSEGPPGGLGWVSRLSRRCGRCREALLEGWEGSGVPPGGPGGVGSPS